MHPVLILSSPILIFVRILSPLRYRTQVWPAVANPALKKPKAHTCHTWRGLLRPHDVNSISGQPEALSEATFTLKMSVITKRGLDKERNNGHLCK